MLVIAKLRYLRIAPRKVRLVADLIRGKLVEKAQTILGFTVKKAALPLFKLLKSAIANAKTNFQLEEKNLYISKILVDEGPKYKRWMPRSRGQASAIQKKTSHITIVLDEIIKKPKKIKKIKGIKKIKESRLESDEREKIPKIKRPEAGLRMRSLKPKIEKGVKRIFRRKAF